MFDCIHIVHRLEKSAGFAGCKFTDRKAEFPVALGVNYFEIVQLTAPSNLSFASSKLFIAAFKRPRVSSAYSPAAECLTGSIILSMVCNSASRSCSSSVIKFPIFPKFFRLFSFLVVHVLTFLSIGRIGQGGSRGRRRFRCFRGDLLRLPCVQTLARMRPRPVQRVLRRFGARS